MIAKFEGAGPVELGDAEIWGLITKLSGVRARESGRDAWHYHKTLGHPIVIWRDGKVITVPPEEIEV